MYAWPFSVARSTFLLTLAFNLILWTFAGSASTAFGQTPADSSAQSKQLVQATPITALPAKGKRYALIIGVDKYRDGQITPLSGGVNDAHQLADALVKYAGFPQDQVIVLATDQPEERQPTRINILTNLSYMASYVPKDGLLLVSFSGHGIERDGRAFLIPADARLSQNIALLEESAVSVTRMHEWIKATGVSQVVVLLDACRNDPGGRADAPNPLSTAYTNGFSFDVRNREVEAYATLYATQVGNRAWEYTEKKQGYFSWAVVQGLQGGAANAKGEVTLAALVSYVQENVPKRILIDLGPGRNQKPFADIGGYGANDLVLAVAAPSPTAATNASTSQGFDPASIELSFWESIKNSTDAADFRAYLDKYGESGRFTLLARNRLNQFETAPKTEGAKQPATAHATGVVPRGNVALVFTLLNDRGRDSDASPANGNEFTVPLAATLSDAGLSVSSFFEQSNNVNKTITRLGGKHSAYVLIIRVTLSLSDLSPTNGLFITEANGSIELVDGKTNRVMATESVSRIRGFGTVTDQAKRNALKNAAEGVSGSFIKKVAANAN